jgi:hypothetical protein
MPTELTIAQGKARYTALVSDEGLRAVQTLEDRQRAYVDDVYAGVTSARLSRGLPARMRDYLNRVAHNARKYPTARENGLPRLKGIIVPWEKWRRHVGGLLIQVTGGRRIGQHGTWASRGSYVPILMEGAGQLDERRPIILHLTRT